MRFEPVALAPALHMPEALTFPPDFTFGVATSAYQTEGGLDTDWTDWEEQGRLKEATARAGRAIDHWNRFFDDVELIKKVGATAYRLSIEWARIERESGKLDDAAIAGYRKRLEHLVANGIRPMVTLHHFTHPRWFHAESPWHSPKSLERWTRYVKVAAEILQGIDGAMLCTLNEPNVFLAGAYLGTLMPPGRGNPQETWAACANLMRAHVIARNLVRERSPNMPVGIAQHFMIFAPSRVWHPLDQALTRLAETNFNHAILEALTSGVLQLRAPGFVAGREVIDGAAKSMEYLGINYYTRGHLKFVPRAPWLEYVFKDPKKRGLTDIGWEWYPEGFSQALREVRRYGLPVWVTENGLDDRTGTRRSQFLFDHWKALLEARAEGTDVRGYLHWSLFDNFEWLEAWGPRFGLYAVDFDTLERKSTPACEYFHRVATSKTLTTP